MIYIARVKQAMASAFIVGRAVVVGRLSSDISGRGVVETGMRQTVQE